MKPFDGSFFDEDYFQKGRETGKSWFSHHHWMPQRSLKEGLAFIDYLGLDDTSYVLDFGCSMGFLVKALRILEIKADGCDISDYALSFAPEGCWNCSDENVVAMYAEKKYTHIIIKDVLEHLTDPLEQVKIWVKKLKVNGVAWIELPDSGCSNCLVNPKAKELGVPDQLLWEPHMIPYEHIYYYTQDHVRKLFTTCGCVCLMSENWLTTDRMRLVFKRIF